VAEVGAVEKKVMQWEAQLLPTKASMWVEQRALQWEAEVQLKATEMGHPKKASASHREKKLATTFSSRGYLKHMLQEHLFELRYNQCSSKHFEHKTKMSISVLCFEFHH